MDALKKKSPHEVAPSHGEDARRPGQCMQCGGRLGPTHRDLDWFEELIAAVRRMSPGGAQNGLIAVLRGALAHDEGLYARRWHR